MPYNNTPIVKSKEITGTVALPLARVKKIINVDEDIGSCSNNAAFVITVAAEMFLQHLVEQSYNIVKSERKPRRNVQYRDVANAVARVENLEFLSDVVPKTTTYKQVKQKQAKEGSASDPANGLANGQGTLDHHMGGAKDQQATNGANYEAMELDNNDDDDEEEEEEEADGMTVKETVDTGKFAKVEIKVPAHRPGQGVEEDDDDDDDETEES